MKRSRRFAILTPALAFALAMAAPPVEAGGSFGVHVGSGGFGVSVGFGDWSVYTSSWSDPNWSLNFNTVLAGYGEWVWVGGIGRVWRPWVSADWRPYTYGRWVRTAAGWTWVSYEPWGYVPHHYGSWAYSSFGWVWQPGYAYVGANVVWVRAGGYVGWYARPPYGWSHAAHGFRRGYDHGYRDGYHHGYDNGLNDARYATYVGWDHLGADNVSRHTVRHAIASRNRIDAHASAPTNAEIRARGAAPVSVTRLSRRTVSMGGRQVTVARPEGVARSIERHAAGTAGAALAPAALERRQPLVRARSAATSTASISRRTVSATRETHSANVRQRQEASSSNHSRSSGTATGARIDARSAPRSAGSRSSASNGLEARRSARVEVSHKESSPGRTTGSRTTAGIRRGRSVSTSTRGQSAQGRRAATEDRRTGRASRPQRSRSEASDSAGDGSKRSNSTRPRHPHGAKRR